MTRVEQRLTNFMASGAMSCIAVLVALLLGYMAYSHPQPILPGNNGIFFSSPNIWLADMPPLWQTGASLLALAGVLMLMAVINNRFNILRSYRPVYIAIFALFCTSIPMLTVRFQGGTLQALLVLTCILLLYQNYGKKNGARPVFMVFFLLGLGTLASYTMLFYAPVMLVGAAQMRLLSFRTLLAAGLGFMTPLWILWGFTPGVWPQLHMPDFEPPGSYLSREQWIHAMVSIGVSAIVCVVLTVSNILRILAFNAKSRAINSLLTIVTIVTVLMMVVDYSAFGAYFTLLGVCIAYQTAHYFLMNTRRRSYILLSVLMLGWVALSVWNLF